VPKTLGRVREKLIAISTHQMAIQMIQHTRFATERLKEMAEKMSGQPEAGNR
jgi:hypothetical protein